MSVSITFPKLSFQYFLYGPLPSVTSHGRTTVVPISCVMIGLHFVILILPLEHWTALPKSNDRYREFTYTFKQIDYFYFKRWCNLYISIYLWIVIDLNEVRAQRIASESRYICLFVLWWAHILIQWLLVIRTFDWNRYRVTSQYLLSRLADTSVNTLVVWLYTVDDMSNCHFTKTLEFSRVFKLVRTHRNLDGYKWIKY